MIKPLDYEQLTLELDDKPMYEATDHIASIMTAKLNEIIETVNELERLSDLS